MSNTTGKASTRSVEGAATDFDLNKEMAIEERRRCGSSQIS